jgi:hypothetical protein
MKSIHFPQWLIQLVVVMMLPTVTCFGYYSLEYLGEDKATWALPVMMAYPVALIGMVGLFHGASLVQAFQVGCVTLDLVHYRSHRNIGLGQAPVIYSSTTLYKNLSISLNFNSCVMVNGSYDIRTVLLYNSAV